MMNDRLDYLVTRLAAAPADRPLDHFEAEISQSIARRRADARTSLALAPVGVAVIGLALAMGATVGSLGVAAASAEPRQLSTFAIHAHLAPSTLLEGG